MATIRAFRGLRYTPKAGSLSTLTAPPYDVLNQEERDALAAQNEFNVVLLTLPEQKTEDRSKYVKYARSAARLAEFRREGVLAPESAPALYRYTQTFAIPGVFDRLVRTTLIALIKTEPYEKGVVLPHEQTFPKHKEDRLRILEATRAHLECIFGLFEDDGTAYQAILDAPAATRVEVTTEDGVEHILEPITDPEAVAALEKHLDGRTVWIADGHHRYETARNFRESAGEAQGEIAEDYMMMALGPMSDPGLVLLPTHRIVKSSKLSDTEVQAALGEVFELRPTPNRDLMPTLEGLGEQGKLHFGLAMPGGQGFLLAPKDPQALLARIEGEESERLRALDVTVLHRVIFEQLLGIQGLDAIAYTRDPDEAAVAPDQGAAMAFLMNPPSVDDMKAIALGGEKMPQKSTYYYPKILSGLVLWSLNDF